MSRTWQTNITVSLILELNKKIILVKEAEGSIAGKWNTPSGHVEENEDIHEAACREGLEESGYLIRLVDLLRVYHRWNPDGTAQVNYVFIAIPVSPIQHPLSSDVSEARWFTRKEITEILNTKNLRSDLTRTRLADWLAGPVRPYREELVKTIRAE